MIAKRQAVENLRGRPKKFWSASLVLLSLPATLAAAALSTPAPPAETWQPPPPPKDNFDWIQLKSGEWLKGEIKDLENGQLEFDSEKMDLHTFELDDVIYARSSRRFDVLRTDRSVVSGLMEMTRDLMKIDGNQFPRSAVTAVNPSGTTERQRWTGQLTAGLIGRTGNTETADFTSSVNLMRRTPHTRLKLDYSANLSQQDNEETANNQRGTVNFDKFVSAHAFWRVPSGEYFTDRFENIRRRLTLGGSYGYDFFRERKRELDITVGPAWQRVDFVSVAEGESPSKDTVALVVSTHYAVDLTQDISYSIDYRGQLTSKDVGETTHHAEGILTFKFTRKLDLDLSLTWDRIAKPKPDENGNVPKPDDFRLSVSLGIKL